jgi:hypothetical protein
MSNPRLTLRSPQTARLSEGFAKPLGQVLVEQGALDQAGLLRALGLVERLKVPLSQVVLAEGLVSSDALLRAEAARFAAIPLDIEQTQPDPSAARQIDVALCLEHRVFPWMWLGDTLVVATADPEGFETVAAALPETLGEVLMGVARAQDIESAIGQAFAPQLTEIAESGLDPDKSCRGLHVLATARQMRWALAGALVLGGLILLAPNVFFLAATGWAVLTLAMIVALKVAALGARLLGGRPRVVARGAACPTPRVSLLVPLFRETDIAGALVDRLSRLDYPRPTLEVLLILEAEDAQTRAALKVADLPPWMRVITVPPGQLTTKPRALNYARRFASGEIIGVYDAEDSPAPDQIETVVRRFAEAPDDVGCLQGVLDFYNPRMNWLARCFTIEYAAWFRVMLPGLSRLGFTIPLGGTTIFFRRAVLDRMQGWDAYNVTEDADLGFRLARAGYRTEVIDTVTLEEANCRFWPWIRQRSRWLKGYMATYAVHMRHPRQLWQELGPKRFFGFQIFFLAALSQFLLAPLLWSFWLAVFGLPHPFVDALPDWGVWTVTGLFLCAEIVGLTVGLAAVASPRHRHLSYWVPTLLFYFPLAAVAAYKALAELVTRPFYWDKTSHGFSLGMSTHDH